jgi:hypothetical protein
MSTLAKELRKHLENAVLKAREEAERGAAAALESFGVGDAKKPVHLDKVGEDLRKKLRARGRQAGDLRRPDESQEIGHLVQECAYEHWHRMLFARFLAENGLLIEPESGLDVDLDYCEEQARESKSDKWEVAASFAQRMLTGVFRLDDPVLQLRLPTEFRNRLTSLLASLPSEVFTASDSLGWTYQFWQTKRKKEVNDSEVKIGADELSPVTQLFTEDYMVDFLLDNTLGAWHSGKVLAANPRLAESARSEDELRHAVALPGCPWSYLRFIQGKDSQWTPAAGTFVGWPTSASALRALDPCMGSGHFVVAMFELLVALRLAEEKLDEAAAVAAVIRDNLFGLEIDPRCTQIGAFNLALAAWRRVGHCKLPAMNLACSGLAPNTREADWLALAGEDGYLKNGMARLFRLFKNAPVLGSLINPRVAQDELLEAAFHELQPLLEKALAQEIKDDTAHEMAVTARGLAKAAEILAGQFTLVATNVPYLGRGKQDEVLQDYCERVHPQAKADLATCFVERCLDFCSPACSTTLVTPQNWLFLGSYEKLRADLLERVQWDVVARLGAHAFETIGGEVVNVCLLGITRQRRGANHVFAGFETSEERTPSSKAASIQSALPLTLPQDGQLKNPDCRIVLGVSEQAELLSVHADSFLGLGTGDYSHYGRCFWEFRSVQRDWAFQQGSVDQHIPFGGREQLVYWDKEVGRVRGMSEAEREQIHNQDQSGQQAWGKTGVCVSLNKVLPVTHYSGELFDKAVAVLVPKKREHLIPIRAFAESNTFQSAVRALDQKTIVANGTLLKVSFDLAHWQKVAAEKYPHGLPNPFSSDPTQWLFNGHPAGADQPLHVAVARLLGHQWPRQTGSSFPDCPALGPDGLEKHADKDGVVCFSQVRDEPPAAGRLRALLADAYGKEWSHAMERKLIAATGSKADSLEDWLLNDFFKQHCDLFHSRPFVWHLWDGRKDGFNVLVNYHRLAGPDGEGHRTLETLAYAYLGDWITRQKDAMAHGEAGADDRLAAALELQGELKKIVAGEPPYDLFIRWKPLHEQPMGWQPDINDGVRLNIRPFLSVDLSRGKKGCGLFRAKPGSSLKWEKDRGNEPHRPKENYPWFWSWDKQTVDFKGNGEFDGNRWNDCHYTTAVKVAARDKKARE